MQKKIVITGFGGQGVVLAGRIVGKAAAIRDGLESTLVQSYGPESRGGACSAQVTIADRQINYPYIQHPDILVAMSQAGYEKYKALLIPEGILIVDQDLVTPEAGAGGFSVPSTRFAEEMGLKMIANIIMVGFFTAITDAITLEAARQTVRESVPKGTEEKNLKAFEKGWAYGRSSLKARAKKAAGQIGAFA
ncbi:2-oxoacid:acceptor oxidoreductase family protein [Desulfosarcina ovata]|uniref:2-oxoglutarate ferredoxin oxidoreductase subunit gamma n=1 Tax=Desulfosarcina ovata subsp. ovata TaxID=2752305 RepID=A0A5K8A4C2_9BACT|nr:2-oxoacid:acceptor oxidoreductase family protein [Desulfosarcina ovata]BBO87276.1 2-oxoglutarate ferredoxin oxidoreductase subunit gamma [Desulfosarcina ovata subsp. ovata]